MDNSNLYNTGTGLSGLDNGYFQQITADQIIVESNLQLPNGLTLPTDILPLQNNRDALNALPSGEVIVKGSSDDTYSSIPTSNDFSTTTNDIVRKTSGEIKTNKLKTGTDNKTFANGVNLSVYDDTNDPQLNLVGGYVSSTDIKEPSINFIREDNNQNVDFDNNEGSFRLKLKSGGEFSEGLWLEQNYGSSGIYTYAEMDGLVVHWNKADYTESNRFNLTRLNHQHHVYDPSGNNNYYISVRPRTDLTGPFNQTFPNLSGEYILDQTPEYLNLNTMNTNINSLSNNELMIKTGTNTFSSIPKSNDFSTTTNDIVRKTTGRINSNKISVGNQTSTLGDVNIKKTSGNSELFLISPSSNIPRLYLIRNAGSDSFSGDGASDWAIMNASGNIVFERGNSLLNNGYLTPFRITYYNTIELNYYNSGAIVDVCPLRHYRQVNGNLNSYYVDVRPSSNVAGAYTHYLPAETGTYITDATTEYVNLNTMNTNINAQTNNNLLIKTGTNTFSSTANNSSNWDTAYTDSQQNKSDILTIKGAGWTNETIKQNADDIATNQSNIATNTAWRSDFNTQTTNNLLFRDGTDSFNNIGVDNGFGSGSLIVKKDSGTIKSQNFLAEQAGNGYMFQSFSNPAVISYLYHSTNSGLGVAVEMPSSSGQLGLTSQNAWNVSGGNITTKGANDNVGIGTPSSFPSRLTFGGGTESKICLFDGGSGNMYGFGVSNNQLNYHVNTTSDRHVFYAGGTNGNGSELMRIQGDGQTILNGYLNVNQSNQFLVQTDASNGVKLNFQSGGGITDFMKMGAYANVNNIDNFNRDLVIRNGSGASTEIARFKSSHVELQNSSHDKLRFINTTTAGSYNYMSFYDSSTRYWYMGQDGNNGGDFMLGGNFGRSLLVDRNTGEFKIQKNTDVNGTLNVSSNADVNGAIFSKGSSAELSIVSRSSPSTKEWTIYSSSGDLQFYQQSTGADRLIVDSSGNVGIGTTPSLKLTVAPVNSNDSIVIKGHYNNIDTFLGCGGNVPQSGPVYRDSILACGNASGGGTAGTTYGILNGFRQSYIESLGTYSFQSHNNSTTPTNIIQLHKSSGDVDINTGSLDIQSGNLQVRSGTTGAGVSAEVGIAKIGNGISNYAMFSHKDQHSVQNYALLQSDLGETFINAKLGRKIFFRINNNDIGVFDNTSGAEKTEFTFPNFLGIYPTFNSSGKPASNFCSLDNPSFRVYNALARQGHTILMYNQIVCDASTSGFTQCPFPTINYGTQPGYPSGFPGNAFRMCDPNDYIEIDMHWSGYTSSTNGLQTIILQFFARTTSGTGVWTNIFQESFYINDRYQHVYLSVSKYVQLTHSFYTHARIITSSGTFTGDSGDIFKVVVRNVPRQSR
jgi:hypothetical protein